MKALQYRTIGSRPELVDVEKPTPTASEILLRVTAAGACHSDEFIMGVSEEEYFFKPVPLTLGHEVAGVVEAIGEGVTDVEIGESVIVYGPWGCGRCYHCAKGDEMNCEKGMRAPGIFSNGGMAEYMIVDDARHLVPLGDLDPVTSVSLTDAGLTPYRAVKSALDKLTPGTTAVVIGAGGLGHVAIQLLKALTQSTVVALDLGDKQLEFATEVGADHVYRSEPGAADSVKQLTRGLGADVVFDFVGIQPTADLAAAMVSTAGRIVVVGVASGAVPIGQRTVPLDVTGRAINWGSRAELMEVVELAKRGAIVIHVERYSLDDATDAYDKLHAGEIRGRAVIVP
ncbi:NAD(P)-dependent alcohol dehydrogenase [Rhodococcus sp. IEGM 1381]|uniref:NAD(P)-dependent alcohol dehydrogenase n=1 Tax=Rhodococcus sp. IEGM 1381 TaxID=3047085 RepID=UPI0024B80447|nr:NAD(P)-dependent alcohol dehydrogenase [Rhodococcus sp. IEGM 1381]MDI9897656.1 NAD(P)-dependent alcohol dehydrogenase [Rhodococcus sp. IEGM 1381]